MATATTNSDALLNPTYNPDIDPSALAIFNIMGNSYPDDLVAQYRQVITGMPTTNAYGGVLNNPRSCDISQAQTGLAEIGVLLSEQYQDVISSGTPVPALAGYDGPTGPGYPGYEPTSQQIADAAAMQLEMPGAVSDLAQANSAMSDFQDHTDSLISNLPAILGMVQSALGLQTALGGLQNPCSGLSNFLGSLTHQGNSMMTKINAAIRAIGGSMSAIVAGLARVKAFIQSLAAMIEAEISHLIKSLIDGSRLGLAQMLSSMKLDPCLGSILQTVSTGAVIGVMARI